MKVKVETYNETLNSRKGKLEALKAKFQSHKHAIAKSRIQDRGEVDRIVQAYEHIKTVVKVHIQEDVVRLRVYN